MGRVTTKTIKEHIVCACGSNTSDQFTERATWSELKQRGYTPRRFRNTKEYFFFKRQTFQSCDHCDPDGY